MAEGDQTTQNTTSRYLLKKRLQALLERLFPGQTEFNIRVRLLCFYAPFDRTAH
jgi:hypothetical protein